MSKTNRDFRILDKDLGRISNAEAASIESFRPVIRLGIGLLFVAMAALISFGAFGDHPALGIIVAGVAVSAYLALSIGANDVANSLGPAVGAGAIGMTTGLVLVGILQIAGAVLAGDQVAGRLADGIVLPGIGDYSSARVMLAALLAAASWISLATWAGAPVSTTHTIVGAIAGAGIATHGWGAVNWPGMATIALGWMISPLCAGLIAAALMALLRRHILDTPDKLASARRLLPFAIAIMAALFVLNVMLVSLRLDLSLSLVFAAILGGLGFWHARRAIDLQIAAQASPRAAMKVIFSLPLALSALMMGFAHGSNDAANVTAPLGAVLRAAEGPVEAMASWTPLLAGLGIAAGAMLFGRRLVHMVGSRITKLNSARAFCVSLATVITVLAASAVGLPVSTTHVAVGGVFGIGFYREWRDSRRQRKSELLPIEENRRRHLVRRSHVRTIFGAWLISAPAAGLLGALCAWAVR